MNRTHKFVLCSLMIGIIHSAYYLILGTITGSGWLLTLSLYHLILSAVRFVVLKVNRGERFVTRFTGWMMMTLSLPLISSVILSVIRDRGHKFHMIVMITIATYAFTKLTLATINLIQSQRIISGRIVALRNISFADGFVSIFALQRSMLVSFEGMTEAEILIMNTVTGSAVCVIVFLLGFNLVRNENSVQRIERL